MIHCPNTTHIALIAKLIENETKRKLMMEMCDDTNIYGQRGNIIAVNKSVLYLPYTYLLNVVSPCNRWPTSVLRLALRCRCWLISQCNIIAPFMKETPTQVYYTLEQDDRPTTPNQTKPKLESLFGYDAVNNGRHTPRCGTTRTVQGRGTVPLA